ncbi:hypothetical protein L1887_08171 [Cichorium endivia]|nr:hypothetical protein L1887_08171 [Cichorium endivia]
MVSVSVSFNSIGSSVDRKFFKRFLNPKSQKASVKSEQIDEPETKAQVKPISVKKEHDSKAGFQLQYRLDFRLIGTNENLAIKKNGDAVDDPGMVASMVDMHLGY